MSDIESVLGQVWLNAISWDERGLVAAIAQDFSTREVLMMAWMSRQSLALTLATGDAHYWSRSRKALWKKGESSGHIQHVKEIHLDCDGDTVLLTVEQVGGIACHTGRPNCFFRRLESSPDRADAERDPHHERWVLTSPALFSAIKSVSD